MRGFWDNAAVSDSFASGQRLGALSLVVLGVVVGAVGVAGSVAGWGASATKVYLAAASPAPTTSTLPTASRPSTSAPLAVTSPSTSAPATVTTPSTSLPTSTPAQFVGELDRALTKGDVAFLYARLHPAVISRYGAAQCRVWAGRAKDTTSRFVVRGAAGAPADYSYTTDSKTTVIHAVVAVPVDRVSATSTVRTAVHTVAVDGTFRFFTDCGTPLG